MVLPLGLRRLVVAVAGLILLAFSTGAPLLVLAQETSTIKGQVVNRTTGADLREDINVLMLVTSPDGRLSGTGQTGISADGRFQFGDLELHEDSNVIISVDYGGVFSSVTFTAYDRPHDITLFVFDTTSDAGVIEIERQTMVVAGVDESEHIVSAIEFVRLINPTDRTLQPDVTKTDQISFLRFALPPGATGLTVESDLPAGDVISIGTGFALTSPVMPGAHSITFSYEFPYDGDAVAYRQSLVQGADLYQILVPESVSGVQVVGLDPVDTVQIEDKSYRAWEGRDLPPGQGLELAISGLPEPGIWLRLGNSVTGGAFWQITIPSALGAVLAGLLIWGALRPHSPVAIATAGGGATSRVSPRRASLVRSVAALDENYDRGSLNEAEYSAERTRLVERILGEDQD